MKSRTLTSFCQSPDLKPSQAGVVLVSAVVALIGCILTKYRSIQFQERTGVPGDHQFFVGRNYPDGDFALLRRDPRPLAGVCFFVELDAEPCGSFADPLANLGGVFPDAGGEDECVNAA